jgi:hypothetical protein
MRRSQHSFLSAAATGCSLRAIRQAARKPEATIRERFSEPLRNTVLRTGSIAVAIGLGVGLYLRRPAAVPVATIVALWFTLGGHVAELLFRNGLGAKLGSDVPAYLLARVVYWFAAGSALFAVAWATLGMLSDRPRPPWPWWIGGTGFVVAELLVHLGMRWRGEPSVYDGRG